MLCENRRAGEFGHHSRGSSPVQDRPPSAVRRASTAERGTPAVDMTVIEEVQHVRRQRRGAKLLALVLGLFMIAAACGDDDDESSSESEVTGASEEPQQRGEIVDLGTFVDGPPEHIDPALNTMIDAYQVVNAVYDGLTEVDASDPDNPQIVPQVAETVEANEDATQWVFTIRDGLRFADGEEILPSTFERSWERASDPEFAGDYSYLFIFIEGGAEKLDGTAPTLAGVTADDDAMTLTVDLAAPYSSFAAVAGFQTFMPVPEAAGTDAAAAAEWENGEMFGNGPFMLDAAADRHRDRPGPEPRVGRHQVHRSRPAGQAVPRQDHLPGDGRPRHLVQLVRGR